MRPFLLSAIALLALLPLQALAEGSLLGRMVTMSTLTYDSPDAPMLETKGATVMVGNGIEFGLGPEGVQNGLDVVPVQIEILPRRIEISYPPEAGEGQFWQARFNGYVLEFHEECALFTAAHVDTSASNMGVTDADLTLQNNALYINVSQHSFGPDKTLAIDLEVSDCLMG
jgi:hypothetical protein